MIFEDEIEEKLRGLNRKQLCQFAWLCGVRALPFLNVGIEFTYWLEKDMQKYLYSIFYALDIAAAKSSDTADTVFFSIATRANTAIKAITETSHFAIANNDYYDTRATIYAASAVANAAAYNVAYAARDAANAADAAKVIQKYYFNKILSDDIDAIKENRLDKCNYKIYSGILGSFQGYLKAVGCDYWAKLYENLFKNGFDSLDEEELKRRLGVPDEIKAEGAVAVGRYLEELGDNIERLNEARIIILGEKGAGKTSLARRLLDINKDMPKEDESTEGVETNIWTFKNKEGANVNAHVWDFAGHSITHSAHRCFMSARCLYIYVYNGRIERNNDPTYWLEQIRIHGGDSPILFLINEKDGHKADIAERTLRKDYPSIVNYYPVDIGSEDKTKLEEFRQTVMNAVCDNPSWNNQVVSVEAYKIKNELRERFDKEKEPHITREQFDKIAENCRAQTERIKGILDDLHTLGICLWYDKEEMEDFNTLVLNPDWITNGIYKIINEGFKEDKHILSVDKGTEILKNDEKYKYPRDKVAYLFKLMRLYELAFFKNTENIFIPGILPIDRPDSDKLPTFDDAKDRLTMSFVVQKTLPPNIVARIIVQRHEDIFDEKLLWRKGAVLKLKNSETIALIIEDERSVTVSVKGTDKTVYIVSLRETIKTTFDSYKVIKPDLLYEVLVPEDSEKNESLNLFEEKKPLMLSAEKITAYLKRNRLYLDEINDRDISLAKTELAYAITKVSMAILLKLLDSANKEQFKKILNVLKEVIKSEQVKKDLTTEQIEIYAKEIIEISDIGRESGRERLRRLLSDIGSAASILSAVSMCLS